MTTSFTAPEIRSPDVTALALLALTMAVGIASYGDLPAEMVVGWHVGLDGDVRLTHAPRQVAAFAVPTAATGTYAVLRAVESVLDIREELADFESVYDVAVHLLLVGLFALQAVVVAANL
ncbi:hypothetical protein [Halorussus salinisoli]|uniref:hypothetical protein n=1 Tax=Halorussus salinisoli TaxID=2558242 RepID=UPI0010C1AD07|nr:hypothetical protein [Halorussus salinisoli]